MRAILALLFVLVGGSAWGQCSTSNWAACPGTSGASLNCNLVYQVGP